MGEITLALVVIVISLVLYRFIWLVRRVKYWKSKNVGYSKAENFSGGLLSLIQKTPLYDRWYILYSDYPGHKFVAVDNNDKPLLLARDAEFVQKIMIKDFQYFVDHDKPNADEGSLFSLGLFGLTGNEWRGFRAKISPTFTSGKLKSMFDQLEACSDAMLKSVEKSYEMPDYDVRDDVMSYAMDVTASAIFGIEFRDEELRAKYKKTSSDLFKASTLRMLCFAIHAQFPRLAKFLGLKTFDQEKDDFFKNIIKQTFDQRKANNVNRNDYVQLLLNLKEFGKLEVKVRDPDDDYLKIDDLHVENVEVTDDILAAQAFQFLTGGLEPIYNRFLIEIAQYEDIQNKLRKEIQEVKTKNDGYNYKSVREMLYLEQCIHETLRKYPIIPFLMRYCVKDYMVNSDFTIEKGTLVVVSTRGIQNDPAYFPNPEKFDPERFSANGPIKNIAYLPFGAGPRVCIGMRFAIMEMKLGLAKIIENFSIKLGDKAKFPVEFNKRSFFLSAPHGYLKMTKIK
ncbi:cytochrome P450 6B1-like isoform X3 [Cimex lectularius]|uniref:Cytochrome P450 n=1 Tax=Cimex lectularius TaxID=79782 RepID=A0A8I6ST98_CIMLE|nr:cytochrome P450 6B1-like isoform X3 [Cimex lectularius]